MAKFTNKDLRLKDGEKVTFGTTIEANIWWDESVNDLNLDHTISGVDPTQNYHLTTKWYVDQAVTSGSVVSGTLPHHNLTAFDAYDDHLQYVPTNASRGFTASVSGIDPTQSYELTTKFYVDDLVSTVSGDIVVQIPTDYVSDSEMTVISGDIVNQIITDHGGLTGLGDDDHPQYILTDGTRSFSNTVSGVTPIVDAHLATKGYVDSVAQGLDWQDSVLDIVPLASGVQVTGNRYIASTTSGSWTQDNIYEWNGSSWTETVTLEGFAAWVEVLDALYVYSNGAWVQFGSTVTHNNLSGLYGDGANYYHLDTAQHSALTDGGNASYYHIHDDRYYTESEITVISGDIVNQIPTDYVSDSEMTVISGDIMQNVSDNYISNSEMTTISGDIINYLTGSGIIDHGDLTGLSDDDHPQYILVDGSRGFTSTVSGVYPIQDYHLATKAYVDEGGIDRHGRQSIANGASYVDVSFTSLGHTNYTINATLQNTVDSPPSIYAFIVSATTTSGFRVTLMGDTDSSNYILNWSVIED
jgi:hypothetical protein